MFPDLQGGAVVEGFKGFCEFASHADAPLRSEFAEDLQSGWQAVWGLKEEGSFGGVNCGLELFTALSFFDMEEAVEGEGMGREARGDERSGDGGGAGKDGELDAFITAGFEKAVAGIGEAGRAGVRDNGEIGPILCLTNELWNALLFIVVMQRDEGL